MLVIIDADPQLAFYDRTPPDIDLRWRRLALVGETRSALRVSGGETPNTSLTLDNGDGALTDEITGALLSQPVRVYDGDTLIFNGIIRRISVGAVIVLELEA